MRSHFGKRFLATTAIGLATVCGLATWSGAVEPLRRGPADPREREEAMSAHDAVREYARNPEGEIDGLILKDGTEVKVPPHQGEELRDLFRVGDKVDVEGRRHVTREGDVHLHADRIADVADDRTWERDEPAGHRPPPPHVGPREREALAARRPVPPAGPTNDEILQELRAIRRLLEGKK